MSDNRSGARGFNDRRDSDLFEKLVRLNRIAKVVKGGRRFSFSALVVVGDRNGSVGFGFGKANYVADAIRKSTERAKKNMILIQIVNIGLKLVHQNHHLACD